MGQAHNESVNYSRFDMKLEELRISYDLTGRQVAERIGVSHIIPRSHIM